jgi:3-oxoacyl-(acyl-carrier-protein) synthase
MEGIHVSHSITCSTALHAILNGVAWLRSRLVDRVLVGGTEAPLTDFTVAQMKALGIYSERDAATWPCRPFSLDSSENSFVLGEGAAVFCMERVSETDLRADDLIIRGVGFSTELAASGTGITVDGEVFQRTMTQAIASANVSVDLVLAHAAGTSKGDAAELAAIEAVCTSQPNILSTKYITGHSFGASGALQVDLACHFLEGMALQALPYASRLPEREQRLSNMRNVLVNATGFGGNAVSLVIGKLY